MSLVELSDVVYDKNSKVVDVIEALVELKKKGVVFSLDSRHLHDDIPLLLVENFWDCECEENYIHEDCVCKCEICGLTEVEAPDSRLNEVCNFLDKLGKKVTKVSKDK